MGKGMQLALNFQPTICCIELPLTQLFATPSTDAFSDDEIDLPLSAILQNQASLAQPGHTLEQCNRFVDYIIAESLAQWHPQLGPGCSAVPNLPLVCHI